ncbi:MAG TPA: hypothetical protein VHI52_03760, partial [Verrucomicrobiae bacterium]|nr:hypothetical protein [Verrucomicrobiae bacterium]
MKSGNFWKWYLGVGLTLVPIAGICLAANSSPASTQTEPSKTTQAEAAQPGTGPSPSMDVAGELESAAGEPASTNDIAAAPVQVVSTEKPLPSNIRATGPVAE